MKKINIKVLTIFVLGFGIVFFGSCSKDIDEFIGEQFPELENTSGEMMIDGEVAVPILNSYFTLNNFIPSSDSTFWVTVDDDDYLHFRMYFDSIATLTANGIYGNPVPITALPTNASYSTDTSKIKLHNYSLGGYLYFLEPKFTFIVENEIPFVTFLKIDTLRLHSDVYDEVYVRDDFSNIFDINSPVQQGEKAITEIVVDKTVITDFIDFFAPLPHFVSSFLTFGNDEQEELPAGYSQLTGDEAVTVDLEMDMIANLRIEDIIIGDTIDFAMLDSAENIEQIESITIKIFMDNELPFSGLTQVAFADTNQFGGVDDIIMNVFDGDGWLFESSITNLEGVTTSSVESSTVIVLTQEDLQLLQQYHASKMIITSTLNCSGQYVKIFSWYKLGIRMGLKVTYSGNTGDI